MPFARNEATKYISPTKTPEYLAAGKPVVSTSIRDVVRTYESRGLVHVADDPHDFARACDMALREKPTSIRQARADAFLRTMSWDITWANMERLVDEAVNAKNHRSGTRLRFGHGSTSRSVQSVGNK
jgi:UDP-galactopyranose mutase